MADPAILTSSLTKKFGDVAAVGFFIFPRRDLRG